MLRWINQYQILFTYQRNNNLPEKHKFDKVKTSVKARINMNPTLTSPKDVNKKVDSSSIARNTRVVESEDDSQQMKTLHPAHDFLFKHYTPDADSKVGMLPLYQHYTSIGNSETTGHVSLPTFARMLDAVGVKKEITGRSVNYVGLRRNNEGEESGWPDSIHANRPRVEPLPPVNVRDTSLKKSNLDVGRKVTLPYHKPPTDIMPVQQAQRSFKINDDGTTSGSVENFRNVIAGNSDAIDSRWHKNKEFFHSKIDETDLHANVYEGPTFSPRNPAFRFIQRTPHLHHLAAEYNAAKYSDDPAVTKFGKSKTRALAALYVAHVIEKNPNLTHNRFGAMPDPSTLPKKPKKTTSVMAAEDTNYKVSAIVKILKERVALKEQASTINEKIEDYYIHALYLKQDIDGPDIRHEIFKVPTPPLKENRLSHMKAEEINSHVFNHDRTGQLRLDGYKPIHAIGSYNTTSELADQLASDYLTKHKESANSPLIHEDVEMDEDDVLEEGAVGKWVKKKVKKAVKNGKKGLKKAIVGSGKKGHRSQNSSFVKKAISSAASRAKKATKGK